MDLGTWPLCKDLFIIIVNAGTKESAQSLISFVGTGSNVHCFDGHVFNTFLISVSVTAGNESNFVLQNGRYSGEDSFVFDSNILARMLLILAVKNSENFSASAESESEDGSLEHFVL